MLSLSRQCRLLSINRSSLYYKPRAASELNLELMRLMDKHYTDHPYKGGPRMYVYLTQDEGYEVSRNRVYRLYYEVMGLSEVFPIFAPRNNNLGVLLAPLLLNTVEGHARLSRGSWGGAFAVDSGV